MLKILQIVFSIIGISLGLWTYHTWLSTEFPNDILLRFICSNFRN